ncbi:hypothetical protein JCM9140_1618 [Halalkalibacter wakoensis JCM 9140]|uniref:Major facilitator superfamily (MFS) profile domain-containing protein n=1 Tax=Halalkalibacter wakoensis JCM 9140 TaxID=1236970 RepID=W4Q0V6_9BACI|nr:MFS transporter [Halalkalibacter wakoensis]GAE25612.1 hypothetical protein JCM9140_1618 [Halalkalibacter wakoensis JCM 9140]
MNKRWIVFFVSLVAFFGPFSQTIYVPLIPEVQQHFGSTELVVNLTISIYTLVLALMQMVYGPLVDRFGRKKILIPAILIYIVGSIGAALAPSIWPLILFRAIQASGIAAGSVVATTVIGDLFEGKMLGRSMGTFQMFVSLGPVLGPVVGGLIGGYTTFTNVFWFLSFLGIMLLVVNIYFLKETKTKKTTGQRFQIRDFATITSNQIGSAIVLLAFIQYYTYYQFIVFLPHLLQERYLLTAVQTGGVFLFLTLAVVIGNWSGGRVQEYVSKYKLLLTSTTFTIIATLFYIAIANVSIGWLLVSISFFGLCMGLSSPVQTTLLVNTFVAKRATAIGLYNFSRYGGMAAGPIIGTMLYNYRPFAEFYFSAFIYICVLIFAIQKMNKKDNETTEKIENMNG